MARTWLRSLFTRPAPTARRPAAPRLAVSRLEAREVPAVLWVNVNDPTADVPGDHLFAQIQQAVDAAAPGDVVKVHAGTYAPVAIAKSNITVQEATANSDPVIDAGGGFSGVQLSGSGVTLRGLTVRNTSLEAGEAFQVSGDNNRLFGNAAVDSDVGFSLMGATGNLLEGNTSNGNFGGFWLVDADGNRFVNNTANGNFIGFLVSTHDGEDGSDGNEFVGNTANGNVRDGFQIYLGSGNRFAGNTADENGRSGFLLYQAHDNVFTGNRARDNGLYGVYIPVPAVTGTSNTFTGMVFSGNGEGDSNVPLG